MWQQNGLPAEHMTVAQPPAFQFYARDFLASTSVDLMTMTERGVYVTLLCRAWMDDGLPTDHRLLASMVRMNTKQFEKIWHGLVGQCFVEQDGRYRNKRQEDVRTRQRDFAEKQANVVRHRWNSDEDSSAGRKRSERMAEARKKGTHTKEEWEAMREFFGENCVRCGLDEWRIAKDHIIPIYQGGDDSIRNLQPMCAKCNGKKGPDCTDYRIEAAKKLGKEMPTEWLPEVAPECLPNAYQTPTLQSATASCIPHPASAKTHTPALRRAPLHSNEHRSHAHCGRICLPAFLFSEFVRRRNHPDADREVRDWALEVDRAWSLGGPHAGDEPGDALTFWRAQYQERWPPVLPPKVDTRLPEWAR